MSKYEMPESSKPVFDTELPAEVQKAFRELWHEAHELGKAHRRNTEATKAAAERFHQRLQSEVAAHPVLAQAFRDDKRAESLLEVICHNDLLQNTIRVLIEAYPQGMLWADRGYYDKTVRSPVHVLAENDRNCGLLLWIAEHYPWVFQQKLCQQKPPHLQLMQWYVVGRCELRTVRRFYELYPQGLGEKDEADHMGYPLIASLRGPRQPDADFFIWMAKQFPDAVHSKYMGNFNILHSVCGALVTTNKCTPNMAKIARFLISEHPDLVREKAPDLSCLPIHIVASRCNRPLVQEVVILLMKSYPECVQIRPSKPLPGLYAYPFIQQVRPLIMKEKEINHETSLLSEVSQILQETAVLPTDQISLTSASNVPALNSVRLDSFSEAYSSWATLRLDVLSAQKQDVLKSITDTCRRLKGDDPVDYR